MFCLSACTTAAKTALNTGFSAVDKWPLLNENRFRDKLCRDLKTPKRRDSNYRLTLKHDCPHWIIENNPPPPSFRKVYKYLSKEISVTWHPNYLRFLCASTPHPPKRSLSRNYIVCCSGLNAAGNQVLCLTLRIQFCHYNKIKQDTHYCIYIRFLISISVAWPHNTLFFITPYDYI
jgi:hypothetical protein